MSIPSTKALCLPVLKLVDKLSEGGRKEVWIGELYEPIANEFDLSREQRKERIPSGYTTRLVKRVNWAVTDLCREEKLKRTSRGYVTITEKGKRALASMPESIVTNDEEQTVAGQTPDELIQAAYEEFHVNLQYGLQQHIVQMPPEAFKKLVLDLLNAMGYGGLSEDWQGGSSNDVDGLINQDTLGLDVIYIRAKQDDLKTKVGLSDVQGFVGSLGGKRTDKGILITTSYFSEKALEFVKTLQRPVILIDGDKLTDLMIEHDVGVY